MLAARWIASALFILAVPVFLVLTNVRVAASEERVYHYSYARYDAPEVSGIPRSELDRATREIIAYLRTPGDTLLDIRVVNETGREQVLFNPREVLHMADVRDLFQVVYRLHELAFVYIVAYIGCVYLWGRERSMRSLARQAVIAGGLTVGVLGLVALTFAVAFDRMWTWFHLASFSNDFWQLNPARDHLIQMYPTSFWFDVVLGLGVVTVLQGALLALLGLGYIWWVDRRRYSRRGLRGPLYDPAPVTAESGQSLLSSDPQAPRASTERTPIERIERLDVRRP